MSFDLKLMGHKILTATLPVDVVICNVKFLAILGIRLQRLYFAKLWRKEAQPGF